jgi:Subtilase family
VSLAPRNTLRNWIRALGDRLSRLGTPRVADPFTRARHLRVPADNDSNTFSNRLRKHPKIVEHWKPRDHSNPCIWYVEDELLFVERASPVARPGRDAPTDAGRAIRDVLRGRGVEPIYATSLFSGLEERTADVEDVHLVRLAGHDVDILTLISDLRQHETLRDLPSGVSLNHVLVPQALGDGCPHGPPYQYNGGVPTGPPAGPPSPAFTLIDSGYIWDKHWGVNPLDTLLGHAQPAPNPGLWPTPGGWWQQTPPDRLDDDNDGKLDALAGHANFVAGVLASRCNGPNITIWNHNGSFVGNDLSHVPTELAVLNSLLLSQSQPQNRTRVIVFVFAFPPFGGVLGQQWANTWAQLQAYNGDFVLVAPAGNQSDEARRYPAALSKALPNAVDPFLGIDHPEVIGVASIDATPQHQCSVFSNRGTAADQWVTCSAIGEGVNSTFLHVDMPTEDDPQGPHDFAHHNSWATWRGTSFSAPKVAAAIANELVAGGGTAQDAWVRLRATGTTTATGGPFPDVGIKFPNL